MKQQTARTTTLVYVERLCLQAQRLRSIPRLSVAARGDPDRLLAAVCSVTPSLLAAEGVAIFLDERSGLMRVRAASGFPERFERWASLPSAEMTNAVAAGDGPILRLSGMPSLWPCPETLLQSGARCALWAPIRQRTRVVGGLLAGRNDAAAPFSDDDCLYAEVLAEYIGARLSELSLLRRVDRLQQGLLGSARLASLGGLAASVARGIAGSMDEAAALAERAASLFQPGSSRDGLERIHREVRGVQRLARSLSLFGGVGADAAVPAEPRLATVEEILAATAQLVSRQLDDDGIHLELSWDDDLPALRCDPGELGQALLQLVGNARHALNRRFPAGDDKKRLCMAARMAEQAIEIEVWDAGCGMSAEVRERLAEPFFTTGGRGVGLGLAVCREVIKAHGGALRIDSEEGVFSRFVVVLPTGSPPGERP